MAKYDPEREAHKTWLGLLQPVGLVVSPPALIKAQVVLDRNVIGLQQALQAVVDPGRGDADPVLRDFPRFATEVLGWALDDLAGVPGGPALDDALAVPLPDYGETLRPTYAVIDGMGGGKTLMLVVVAPGGAPLDKPSDAHDRGWHASPQARLERLLRDTGVHTGLLLNGAELRLVYAPCGESSGHLGFPVAEMLTVGGRPILGALHMLLGEHRVFGAPDGQRLADLLVESRKYQTEVSNRLAEQVLAALWELLRGFQAADDAANGRVLYSLPRTDPEQVYGGLLTVIMRLVFLLYAEDQGLMPDDPVYTRNYAIGGLFERLREDHGRHPDTMDQRFGAWAWLLSTFRMVFDGGGHGGLRLPSRHGQLFNPDEYPFLEGRPPGVLRVLGETFDAPRVSDGVIWRVLGGLLVLDGERLSYRSLDVEQVGSVYESMMGFDLCTLPGRTVAVRPEHIVVDLDALLQLPGGKRAAWLKEHAECELPAVAAKAVADAADVDALVVALDKRLSRQTPRALPPGALFLQPGEERRRSGSHYTPRELTEPIVRTTLRPVIEALGERPTPAQILDLKVCDPAMGSGAFLVEACRQLAQHLVAAWEAHGATPDLPPDEDPLLHARRLVAQQCLYGVDKNRFAVNLAKLSLWLVTLARDHAFTFLDHALKHGDSLVGLTKAQIGAFHWAPPQREFGPLFAGITQTIYEVTGWRRQMQALDEGDYDRRRAAWREAEDVVQDVRLIGDLCVAAFFGAERDKEREALRLAYRKKVEAWRAGGERKEIEAIAEELRSGLRPIPVLHWEIEFPEVFGRKNAGFDAVVGNPPFLGGQRITGALGVKFRDWLVERVAAGQRGSADLVAYFFLRVGTLASSASAIGLLATNTIAQGDTREVGLDQMICSGRKIYAATSSMEWPGDASLPVSVVHIARGLHTSSPILDGVVVGNITTYLDSSPTNIDPAVLVANKQIAFQGSNILGQGFKIPIEIAERWIRTDAAFNMVLKRYLVPKDVTEKSRISESCFVITFRASLEEASKWPDLLAIVRDRVKPERDANEMKSRRERWWRFGAEAKSLYESIADRDHVVVVSAISKYRPFALVSSDQVFDHNLVVLRVSSFASIAFLQSGLHQEWSDKYSSTLSDRRGYRPQDCFETFPFAPDWQIDSTVQAAGAAYYQFRAECMVRHDEGLTKIYNRFHDPDERSPDILRLRELHAAMDRAVLDAYGWTDIPTDCVFLLDYEIDEATWGTKKKPWRYRWPDAVRDEVLARLLDLNQKRYQEEVAAGLHGKVDAAPGAKASKPAAGAKKGAPRGPRKAKGAAEQVSTLFGSSEEEA